MQIPTVFRDRLGLGFFILALLISIMNAWVHPGIVAWLLVFHNLFLVIIYANRKQETAYDRTGLWLGLIAAFMPMPFMPDNPPIVLTILALLGYGLIFWSLLSLGRRFGIAPADRGLVTSGPYKFVRHPIYLGELLFRGALLIGAAPISGAVALIVLLMVQILRIAREEKIISGYVEYASQVRWRLIPFIF